MRLTSSPDNDPPTIANSLIRLRKLRGPPSGITLSSRHRPIVAGLIRMGTLWFVATATSLKLV